MCVSSVVEHAGSPTHASSCVLQSFQRDGQMAFYNQGARHTHFSSLEPPTLRSKPYDLAKCVGYEDGHAISFLSGVTMRDFEQPRALWQRVFTEEDRKTAIGQISGHMSTSSDPQSIRQAVNFFYLIDADLGNALASALQLEAGSWQKPLKDLEFIGACARAHCAVPQADLPPSPPQGATTLSETPRRSRCLRATRARARRPPRMPETLPSLPRLADRAATTSMALTESPARVHVPALPVYMHCNASVFICLVRGATPRAHGRTRKVNAPPPPKFHSARLCQA